MKKPLLLVLILVMSISLVVVFSSGGCRCAAAPVEEVAPAEEAPAEEVVGEAIEEVQVLLDEAAEESTAAETTTTETTVTGITVIGSEDFKNKTKLAFSLLYDKARNYYDMVLKYVGIIEYADKGSGIYAWENPPRYKVGKATVDTGTIWYAGTIVHDATHSKLYNDYLATYPSESVPEDIYSGEKAEAICLNVQYDALSKIGADQETLDYVKNAINTKYWEIPYNERWW